MWRNMGVRRDAEGLAEALESIDHWCRYVLPRQFADPTGWELQNMLCVARLMIEAALQRRGDPRGPLPHRFSPDRRRPLAPAYYVSPRVKLIRAKPQAARSTTLTQPRPLSTRPTIAMPSPTYADHAWHGPVDG